MTSYTLLIKPQNSEIVKYYENHQQFHNGDCGFDLYVPEDVTFYSTECVPENVESTLVKFVDFQIQCEMIDENDQNVSYYLYPRSSISKSPLMMANSVGIIDAGYRGNIKIPLRYVDYNMLSNGVHYTLEKDTRIAQICAPSLGKINYRLVDELSTTNRGTNGFGSTGK